MSAIEPALIATMLRDSLQQGQVARLTVSSNSMAPFLRRGDEVLLEAVVPECLNPGDVVTLAAATGLLTHRYWATQNSSTGPQLLTRGDRPLAFDLPWLPEAVVGRVQAVTRAGAKRELSLVGGAGRWLNNHLTWLAGMEYRLWGRNVEPAAPVRLSPLGRGLRRAIYGWATLVSGLVRLM